MNYNLTKDKIEIFDKTQFNITHILECGQIFTYEKRFDDYVVYSADKMAVLKEDENKITITTKDTVYFENFFDLKTDYNKIKKQLENKFEFLKPMLDFGYGIRILKQDLPETVIGFIISANNNIGRIKKSMSFLRKTGEKKENYYAFPTLEKLSGFDEKFFIEAGLGYRSKQIVKALLHLKEISLQSLSCLSTSDLKKELLKIQGIGSKVADCILLFGYGRQDVFPVDTWIEKIYHEYFDASILNREIMRNQLVNKFSDLSGYAQQYLFYFKRSEK